MSSNDRIVIVFHVDNFSPVKEILQRFKTKLVKKFYMTRDSENNMKIRGDVFLNRPGALELEPLERYFEDVHKLIGEILETGAAITELNVAGHRKCQRAY